ncbi:MAG: hypothetical protein ACUVXB_16880 [Bryobacteraceae bacterium]
MIPSLENNKNEIEEYLHNEQIAVFQGYVPELESQPVAFWDTNRHPDFREFLNAARMLGVKTEERRSLEKRLRDLQRYEGFLRGVDLLFDHQGRTFICSRHADCFEEFAQLSSLIDDYPSYEDEDKDEGDYAEDLFSRN